MCSSSTPKPDINTPSYRPDQMGDNFKLTMKPKGGPLKVLQRQPKDGQPQDDEEEVSQSTPRGGLHM